jgi:hypothetical protein
MRHAESLSVLQYNVRKSKDTVMATLLRDPRVMEFDILAIQEPWANPLYPPRTIQQETSSTYAIPGRNTRAQQGWACISTSALDYSKWQFESHGRDVCTVTLTTGQGDEKTIKLHNLYNPDQTGGEQTKCTTPVATGTRRGGPGRTDPGGRLQLTPRAVGRFPRRQDRAGGRRPRGDVGRVVRPSPDGEDWDEVLSVQTKSTRRYRPAMRLVAKVGKPWPTFCFSAESTSHSDAKNWGIFPDD